MPKRRCCKLGDGILMDRLGHVAGTEIPANTCRELYDEMRKSDYFFMGCVYPCAGDGFSNLGDFDICMRTCIAEYVA